MITDWLQCFTLLKAHLRYPKDNFYRRLEVQNKSIIMLLQKNKKQNLIENELVTPSECK